MTTGIIKSANASETITTTPSSAIYGPIEYQHGSTDHINNKFLYIKDMNNGDFCIDPYIALSFSAWILNVLSSLPADMVSVKL